MTQHTRIALKELQRLDNDIAEAKKKVRKFDPLFEEVEQPALVLEAEVTNNRKRLQEMRLEERRLEASSEDKRVRATRLNERLNSVRNLREEAAVSAELDMVERALQSDEQEALTLLDQIRKLELRMEELESALEVARAEVEPKMADLIESRSGAQENLARLEARRQEFVGSMDPEELRMYEGIRAGGRGVAVAELTADGACGYCFSIIPLQLQNEVRHGDSIIRCEQCGVILSVPEADVPE